LAPALYSAHDRSSSRTGWLGSVAGVQPALERGLKVLHYEQGIYPLPRDREVMITAMWALDDFTAANGATLLVPRSHELRDGKPHLTDAIPAEMPAGSVLIFLGRLWHAGGANISYHPRTGVIIDYVQPWLRPAKPIRSARASAAHDGKYA
jgi:ectoine hydroxylase-related dioxygenase (phytanoyl-CoA dioxygenase family)